jgi:RimJ/RimL family protein N-acetyltransferase
MNSFRKLENSDFQILFAWLREPHVTEWWDDGDDTIEKVKSHYSRDMDTVFRFILQSDSGNPIGYFQFYLEQDNVVGIEQFIGDGSLLNMGVGTRAVKGFLEMILKNHYPKTIVVDPDPSNKRAIRCYQKAGFVFQEIKIGIDGQEAYIMKMDFDV